MFLTLKLEKLFMSEVIFTKTLNFYKGE
jgi:hypothetical protein